jgi:hypothetical protein
VPDQLTASSRVPSQYIGLARAFRSEVELIDVALDRALDVITAPIRTRLRKHPKLRIEALAGIARNYQELVPVQFRIGKTEGIKDKTEFAIVERRACVSWLQDDAWDADHREAVSRPLIRMHCAARWSRSTRCARRELTRDKQRSTHLKIQLTKAKTRTVGKCHCRNCLTRGKKKVTLATGWNYHLTGRKQCAK